MNDTRSMEATRHRAALVGALTLVILAASLSAPLFATANPYLAKPGEAPVSVKVATCAIAGGFVHLYTALDNGLF